VSDERGPSLHPLVSGFIDADNYDRARPRYGVEVVATLIKALGLSPGAPVLELGAGTGQLSEALVGGGLQLTAVEPLAETRAMLARVIGEEHVRAGVAEDIPLPDESVDAVLAADSFHWFDQTRAMPEIRRVLRPRGGVAILRSLPLWDGPWAHEIGVLLAEARPDHPAFDGDGAAAALSRQDGYGPVQELTVHSEQVTDPSRLLDYLASFSWVGALGAPAREDLLGRAAEVLERHKMGELRHRVAHLIWIARLL
jgi:SAM-dependent methyltransferase